MSGHSKWSKVKHQKGPADVKRGQAFTKITNAIIISVKQSGGITDPDSNFKLRLAMEKAKSVNMPKVNIQRAIEKAKGKEKGNQLQEIVYEGFGPSGVQLLIPALTDNHTRTSSFIKNILERSGGSLGRPGSVSYNFKSQGIIIIKNDNISQEKILSLVIQLGAEDMDSTDESYIIYTQSDNLKSIKDGLEKENYPIESWEISMEPITLLEVTSRGEAQKVIELIKKLEEQEEIEKVYSNLDIPENILQKLKL